MQGKQSREAEDGEGIRRSKEARRGDDEEAAGAWITGKTEWAEDEAGERERDKRRRGGVAVVITVAVPVVVARVVSEWGWCVVVVIRRGGSRHRTTLGKTGGGEGSGTAARGGAHEHRDLVFTPIFFVR